FPHLPPATTSMYTLSLHDALPIFFDHRRVMFRAKANQIINRLASSVCFQHEKHNDIDHHQDVQHKWFPKGEDVFNFLPSLIKRRSEEHTSELQSRFDLVCRLLLEK